MVEDVREYDEPAPIVHLKGTKTPWVQKRLSRRIIAESVLAMGNTCGEAALSTCRRLRRG